MRNFRRAAMAALLLGAAPLLAACDSTALSGPLEGRPYGSYTSGYDGAAPLGPDGQPQRRIRRVDGELQDYPNLATVPPRPTTFPSPAQRAADMAELQADRGQGQQLQARTAPPPPRGGAAPDPRLPGAPPKTPSLLPGL